MIFHALLFGLAPTARQSFRADEYCWTSERRVLVTGPGLHREQQHGAVSLSLELRSSTPAVSLSLELRSSTPAMLNTTSKNDPTGCRQTRKVKLREEKASQNKLVHNLVECVKQHQHSNAGNDMAWNARWITVGASLQLRSQLKLKRSQKKQQFIII